MRTSLSAGLYGSKHQFAKSGNYTPLKEQFKLNMRKRKKALYSRLYVGLLAAALLAELEEAAEALRAALES
ncbi:hypothetical protein ASE07_09000 [Noviherbaspirillum sp. Root189]|nr:hypothetical protein ASE07_09000 [Noviherbaspirillum sp. Root189]